jgi:hypothetical protein
MLFAGLMAIAALVSAVGLLIDDRAVAGTPIWLKPFKFSGSLAVYSVSWAWLLSLQSTPRRWMSRTGTSLVALAGVEMVIIIGQVLRGRSSHFNVATAFDATLFGLMGVSITALWVLNLVQAVVLLPGRPGERSMTWAIRFGVVLSLVGMALAFLMTGPTAEQLQALQHNVPVQAVGAHSVGVPDGGPGMPITGWSTTGGDLRIPHFVGIHALQALPLFALGLRCAARRVSVLSRSDVRVRLVVVASMAYAGLLALVTWQALRGQALVAPDVWTAVALALIVLAASGGTLFALGRNDISDTRQLEVAP